LKGGSRPPIGLSLLGKFPLVEVAAETVKAPDRVRRFTGRPSPQGANSRGVQEDTRIQPEIQQILVLEPRNREHIRMTGRGWVPRVASLASPAKNADRRRLSMLPQPVSHQFLWDSGPHGWGLISLSRKRNFKEPGPSLALGQIYEEESRFWLAALLRHASRAPLFPPFVGDKTFGHPRCRRPPFENATWLVTTGGASVW